MPRSQVDDTGIAMRCNTWEPTGGTVYRLGPLAGKGLTNPTRKPGFSGEIPQTRPGNDCSIAIEQLAIYS